MPEAWKSISFGMTFKEVTFHFEITHDTIKVEANKDATFTVGGKELKLEAAVSMEVKY